MLRYFDISSQGDRILLPRNEPRLIAALLSAAGIISTRGQTVLGLLRPAANVLLNRLRD